MFQAYKTPDFLDSTTKIGDFLAPTPTSKHPPAHTHTHTHTQTTVSPVVQFLRAHIPGMHHDKGHSDQTNPIASLLT